MSELVKIGEVAARYGVTTRTLRYYEEMGLLRSERSESAYRYYGEGALRRLEQILALRQLGLPVKEIRQILTTQDVRVAVSALARTLRSIDAEVQDLQQRRAVVAAVLGLLRERGLPPGEAALQMLPALAPDALPTSETAAPPAQPVSCPPAPSKEASALPHEADRELTHVRIVQLLPMKVAWYRHESNSPELDAWRVMMDWVRERGLDRHPSTRYFGFDNPGPTQEQPTYGYEVWVTVPEEVEGSAPIETKRFEGGLFAVIPTYMDEIPQRWMKLIEWARRHPEYEPEERQCLEETISPDKANPTQLDLFLPIRRRG